MIPLVFVNSYGQEKSGDLIKEIIKANGEHSDAVMLEYENCAIEAYKLNINTKYYKTQIALFEWEDINSLPGAVLANIEGCIFYFDPDNKTFVVEMDALNKFVENNNIEAPYLITRNLSENAATYDALKNSCMSSPFIIIDLNDQEQEDIHNGYVEVVELLRNNIWSNVNASWFNCNKSSNNLELDSGDDELQIEGDDAEKQLNDFEDLLDSIQKFKTMSQTLKREDVLNNAEKLAEHFAKILSED